MLADKDYDSRALVQQIEAVGATTVIPPRSCQQPRPFGARVYRARNAIERCFGRLKQYRRIATRYGRKDGNFRALLLIAVTLTWPHPVVYPVLRNSFQLDPCLFNCSAKTYVVLLYACRKFKRAFISCLQIHIE